MTKPIYRMRANEALACCAMYLCDLLPIWGLLVAWAIREAWRQRSRNVVFMATQSIWFHVCLLLGFTAYAALHVVGKALEPLSPQLSEYLTIANFYVALAAAGVYGVTCLVTAWMCLDKRVVKLPVIGRRAFDQEYSDEG